MSTSMKADYYNALKRHGHVFQKPYRDYRVAELMEIAESYPDLMKVSTPTDQELPLDYDEPDMNEEAEPTVPVAPAPKTDGDVVTEPFAHHNDDETPIRVDDEGNVWYREEVRKPPYPRRRARRVIKYIDTGAETKSVMTDGYIETFEVAGQRKVESEYKVTLPSYQVGVYRDPRFPFKIHVYNDLRGFDLFDVQRFYGGSDLVPSEIKRIYVENDLCYDIRTTIRAIETEYRLNQLKGKM